MADITIQFPRADYPSLQIGDMGYYADSAQINSTAGFNTTGTTEDARDEFRAYVDLLRTENGRQYGLNIFTEETNKSTITIATKLRILDDNLDEGSGTASCTGIGT